MLLFHVKGVLNGPWKWAHERCNQINSRPTNDNIVVGDNAEGREHRSKTDTSQSGVDTSEYTNVTALELLTENKLHKGDGDTDRKKHKPVWYEEKCTAPFVAEVGEAPEISESDAVSNHSKEESCSVEPSGTIWFGIISIFEDSV